METKICVCCGKVLPIESFGRNKQSSDGRMVTCKECTNKRYRENYKKRQETKSNKPLSFPDGKNPELEKFPARILIAELKARGYTGEIYYTQKTVF